MGVTEPANTHGHTHSQHASLARQSKQQRRRSAHGQQVGTGGRRTSPKNSSKYHARTPRSSGATTGAQQALLKQQAHFQYRALLPTVPENTEYRHKPGFKPLYVKLPVVTHRNPQYTSIRQCLRSYEQWLNMRFPGYDRPVTSANMMRLFFTHPKLFFDLCSTHFKKAPTKTRSMKVQPNYSKTYESEAGSPQPPKPPKSANSEKSVCAYAHGYGLAATVSAPSA
eukprot:TRINITY_DN202_c1_g1_i4.p2 TRINITY_DN202_c1_g1~~TRINITY_DN202_c1_g1_i4.p2  ORF type:complete len:225 (-),score=5.01 TRINITY_DN202_c1_g1_i4:1342-2016(-)